jgi:hypothetical protein
VLTAKRGEGLFGSGNSQVLAHVENVVSAPLQSSNCAACRSECTRRCVTCGIATSNPCRMAATASRKAATQWLDFHRFLGHHWCMHHVLADSNRRQSNRQLTPGWDWGLV